MKSILVFIMLFLSSLSAQNLLRFVNYGPQANPAEGDNNYFQVINIQLPKDYKGNAFIRLYDMSCGSSDDIPLGNWNSNFRFSLYKNELTEKSYKEINESKYKIKEVLLSHFESGFDERYFNNWYTWYNAGETTGAGNTYSIVVEGVSGNDGNAYQLLVSSDSLSNNSIEGVKIYSYEPTLSLRRTSEKTSFKFLPHFDDGEITVKTFDLDGIKCFLSTLLYHEMPVTTNYKADWSANKFNLTTYENENYCTIDIGPVNNDVNDITFSIADKNGNNLPIDLMPFNKYPPAIPSTIKKINFIDCNTVEVDFSESNSSSFNSLDFKWTFDDGFTSNDQSVQRTFAKPGKYFGEVLIEENSNSITRAKLEKFDININSKPIAKIEASSVGAPEQRLEFNASISKDYDGRITNYKWNFGDGTISQGVRISHSYVIPGVYKVILKVEDDYPNSSCNFSEDTIVVTINSQPIPVTKTQIAGSINEIIKFDGSSGNDIDGSIQNYIWDFGAQGIKNGSVVEHKFSAPGNYKVKFIVQDNSTAINNKSEIIINVFINDPPKAFAGKDKIIAHNENMIFNGSASLDSDGKIINYKWNFGDGSTSNSEITSHVYDTPGKYLAKLTVIDNSGTSTSSSVDSFYVTVNESPKAIIEKEYFLKDGIANFDASKSYDNDGIISKYLWDFGDGQKGVGEFIKHNYKVAGRYKVILTVVDNTNTSNNSSSDTASVVINKLPIADAGSNQLIAANTKLFFNSNNSVDPDGKITSVNWYVDGNLKSSEKEFEYLFVEPGTYLVGLEVTDDFIYPMKGIDYSEVKVNYPPVPIIENDEVVAPKRKINFDGSKSFDPDGTILEYSWIFSDGMKLEGKSVQRDFNDGGLYYAILKVTDDSKVGNSTASDTVYFRVNNPPLIKTVGTLLSCNNIITFDASQSVDPDGDKLDFYWEFPNQQRIKASGVISHKFDERGILPVTLSVDDGQGLWNSISKKTITVTLHQTPIADAGQDTTVCAGDIVILSGLKSKSFNNTLLYYEWTFDDSTKLIGSNVFKVFKKGGLYSVILKVTDSSGLLCGISTASKIIKVIEAPIANAGEDIIACANTPVVFDGSKSSSPGGSVSSYLWDFGDGESGSGANPVHIYDKAGQYKVTLTITGNVSSNCDNSDQDELLVTVTDAPFATFTSKDFVALNELVVFDASESSSNSGNIIKYEWDFDDSTSASGARVEHGFKKNGEYNVALKILSSSEGECNNAYTSKTVFVNSKPIAIAEFRDSAGVGEIISFNANKSYDTDGKISNYSWDFGDGNLGKGLSVTHSYKTYGKYKVTLTVFDNTGTSNNSAYFSKQILINESPIARFDLVEKIYPGKELVLNASDSYDVDGIVISYEWFIDDKKISDEKSHIIKFGNIGKRKIKLVVKDNSGQMNSSNEITKYIDVINYAEISVSNKINICDGSVLAYESKINMNFLDTPKIMWKDVNNNVIGKSLNLSHRITGAGPKQYFIEVYDSKEMLMIRDSIFVFINHSPTLNEFSDTTIYIGSVNDVIEFDARSASDEDGDQLKYEWNFGDGNKSNFPIAPHKYKQAGNYIVTIEVDDQKNLECSKVKKSFLVTVKSIGN